ncbi:MAG: phage integrase SAM-like domain-containing protein, partial [Bacteroidota bacterium]
KHQVTNSIAVNKILSDLIESVENEYYKIRNDFPEMKFDEIGRNLKAFIVDNVSPVYNEKHKNFYVVFDEYIQAKANEVTDRTIQKFNTLRKSLEAFDPNITFNKVDLQFFDKYVAHLRNQKPRGRQKSREEGAQNGLLNDTLAKYVDNLKNFMRWSFERKYHSNDIHLHSGFKATRKPKNDIVTLKVDELQKLYEYDFSNVPRLERVRDLFCFGCFTGQRWSDIEAFNKSDVQGDLWTFESYKTKKIIEVPLIGYAAPALDILTKYDFKFPKISAQKFNEYLKECFEAAELDRPVQIKRYVGNKEIIMNKPLHQFASSHMARRTAVSLLLNVYDLPIHMVRDITGHSDIKTLDKYLDKDVSALRQRMQQTQSVTHIMKVVKKDAV